MAVSFNSNKISQIETLKKKIWQYNKKEKEVWRCNFCFLRLVRTSLLCASQPCAKHGLIKKNPLTFLFKLFLPSFSSSSLKRANKKEKNSLQNFRKYHTHIHRTTNVQFKSKKTGVNSLLSLVPGQSPYPLNLSDSWKMTKTLQGGGSRERKIISLDLRKK